ncbi:MAG: hypothetical protein RLY61_390 [Candidatus Parcubacteria bacterium]|jgi:hypothetical protein
MATKKTESSKEESKYNTGEKIQEVKDLLNSINFKNEQAARVQAIQSGKEKVRDRIGRNKERRISSSGRTSLQSLSSSLSSLGNQFKK